jgi:hypothetical protein
LKHFLVVFDHLHGLKSMTEFADEERLEALRERFRLEREYENDPTIEVVLLSAPSPEALLHTHRRYFETPEEIAAG